MEQDLVEMSRRERDVLKAMSLVLKGERTQAEAARLINRSVRQVRRIQRRMEKEKDAGVVHRLRGRPSNRSLDQLLRQRVLGSYRQKLMGFGPTLAAEKLAEMKQGGIANCVVLPRTLDLWLVKEGLWIRQRKVNVHRRRRERRECFGEMAQADASEHDWLEGRGPRMVLVGMIDDATGRITTRFHPAETTEAYMDVLERYVRKFGRPLAWYSDRDSIFRAESKQDRENSVPTQFSRALEELDIQLILANSPQAKGRVERLWGTCQDRWVKELRLAGVTTMDGANQLLESKLEPEFNRKFTVKAASVNDAHRELGKKQELGSILSIQEKRTVGNDYTIRLENQMYQLLPPVWPGERKGVVVVEKRLDGSMKVRFKEKYLEYKAIESMKDLGALPPDGKALPSLPRSLSLLPIPAEGEGRSAEALRRSAVHRSDSRSGRTPALPCPAVSKSCGRGKEAYRPVPTHPWRNGGNRTLLLAPTGGHS